MKGAYRQHSTSYSH